MKKTICLLTLSAALSLAAGGVLAQQRAYPATLAGHALLRAQRMILPPPDAPPGFQVSGRFTAAGNLRVDAIATIPQRTGIALPFVGQPLQGFSGIKPVGDGSYWVLTDNGFGSKRNSPDALLYFSRLTPDWKGGGVTVHQHVFMSDPDRKLPFRIENEHTRERYLTGSDFDPESIQPVADGFWIGEEFGPYLFHVDLQGRVTGVYPTMSGGRELRSPDHPALQVGADPTKPVAFEVPRSGGYEGTALSPDGSTLYALLEKPLLTADGKPEAADGRGYLRIMEFSVGKRAWTGREMRFALEDGATAIGDFNMIDARRALVIERDDGEGDPSMACAQGTRPSDENRSGSSPSRSSPSRTSRAWMPSTSSSPTTTTCRSASAASWTARRTTSSSCCGSRSCSRRGEPDASGGRCPPDPAGSRGRSCNGY